jgi:diguanylate cyclase (GGDEF)-like protein
MERAGRKGNPMALLLIDIDQFKAVNDRLGLRFGDQLLCHVGQTLSRCIDGRGGVAERAGGSVFAVARVADDEFGVIVEGADGTDATAALARDLLDGLHWPFRHGGHEVQISGSMGIAMVPQDNVDLDGLIREAEMALARAKDLGGNTFEFFNDALNAAALRRIELESGLRVALERDEYVLHYQPKADLRTGAVTGVEALLRWHRPGTGLVMPDNFVPALEANGLIVPVGAWVIEQACAQIAEWDRLGLPPLSIAVNISARQFRQPDLAQRIAAVLERTGIAAGRLELELTEGLLMEDNELSRRVLDALGLMGVGVAIDDFGTGHSSLAYLKRFRVSTLKIDRSFVRDVPSSADDCAIAMAVVALARSMKLAVVAEGVESVEQMNFLRTLGCDEIQGYLLSRPLPADQLRDWLRRQAGDHDTRRLNLPYAVADAEPTIQRAPGARVVSLVRSGTPRSGTVPPAGG